MTRGEGIGRDQAVGGPTAAGRETIYALTTPPGRSGVAVVRISGPDAFAGHQVLTNRLAAGDRKGRLTALTDPDSGARLDKCLALTFVGPGSFTGEDVVEYHIHGGRAVIDGVLGALSRLPGHRLAEAGEFTRRAFDNNRLDLTEVEGLADLIAAETEAQRRQALRQMEGELGRLYDSWRDRLVRQLAHCEAYLDFPDEDLPEDLSSALNSEIHSIREAMVAHLGDGRRGERLRDGLYIAILGAPNTGKSSLLNVLARREAAIVSTRAGTTRDVVEVQMDIGGYPVTLADTAGLRDAPDAVEGEGIRRALDRARSADIRLLVLDAGDRRPCGALTRPSGVAEWVDRDGIVVANKIDLVPDLSPELADVLVSAQTGEGIPRLIGVLEGVVHDRMALQAAPGLTRARHREALEDCAAALGRALEAPLPELATEDLRLAVRSLGRITGRVDVEDILDIVFREFCIGK